MFNKIKQANNEFIQYKKELLAKYELGEYRTIKSKREIKDLYYGASKGIMCVLDINISSLF